jgi:hypothetical protein
VNDALCVTPRPLAGEVGAVLAEVVVVVVAAFEVVVVVTAAALVTGTAAFVTTVVGTVEVEVEGPAGANQVDELGPERC